ncbi:chromosomal replication initiator protein DnaA [Eubacterium sp. AB3007]|uniref:chromosomal replication initiator protein DnaA n=1 Tax=Eubacterium sp. AB3007 TaxID=1392487 RepID=UPI000489969C|nr:chromosomal replication initiator protein DnaA [Eubacterium sp. AB3007]MBQ1471515.1 chromosomal replication initiator protein DnaA [Eubacterium sp.]
MSNTETIWADVLDIIRNDTSQISYNTWFLPAHIRMIDDNLRIVYIEAKEDFTVNILKKRYIQMLQNTLKEVMNEEYRVVVKTSDQYDKEKPQPQNQRTRVTKVIKELGREKIFNPKYNFDNFVVGSSNKYAHAAALAVAESPSEAYNPFFIYGGSGLGKTHLMHAIGIYLLEHNDDINVLYVSSEMFTNEFIKAIRENKTREFKEKYREVDVLLIDDIQFLEGKEETQVEFFYTFNTLYDSNKQIVISSDRPPNKLNMLSERLRSRFAWNMIAELMPADYETRVAILMKKAENSNIEMTEEFYEVICLIAEKVKDNIRELEGALNRIISYSLLMNETIDKAFARRILKDILVNNGDSPTPEKIKTHVSRYFNITVADMESSKRTKQVAFPRQIAMYLCRTMTDYSLPKVGNLFGGRHYTTVMHACDKIQKDMATDAGLREIIETLKKDISGVDN